MSDPLSSHAGTKAISLVLNDHDQRLFRHALRTLVSFDAADAGGWASAANRSLKALVRADHSVMIYPPHDGAGFHSVDYHPDVLQEYRDYYRARDLGYQRVRAGRLQVFSRSRMFHRDMDTLRRSECYNDYLVPSGMRDSIGMAVHGDDGLALLAFHRDDAGSADFSERGPALLRMLYPAYESALGAWLRMRHHLRELPARIDTLAEPAALYDRDGALLHANPALLALLAAQPRTAPLEPTLEAAARAAAPVRQAALPTVVTPAAAYRASAVLVHGLHTSGVVLLRLEPIEPALPSAAWLHQRTALTPRQAEVALRLAERRTNAEIAHALVISPHTARHHTEKVLSKLGVHSRKAVREALLRLT